MTLRIAGAQVNLIVGDIDGNERVIADAIDRAESADADVILLPELAVSGYPPEDLVLRSDFVQENRSAIERLAEKTSSVTAVVGFVDSAKGPPRGAIDAVARNVANAAAILRDGRVEGVYHKSMLPNYGVFDEDRYFAMGTDPGRIWELSGHRVGISICEDIWVPDGPPS